LPTVLLPYMDGRDPLGEQALEWAFRAALPGYEPLPSADGPLRAALSSPGLEADAMVIAGRELCSPDRRTPLGAAAVPAVGSVKSLFGGQKVFALVGVSAGTTSRLSDRWVARQLVKRADLVLLSDSDSATSLAHAGVPVPLRVSSDPAWMALGAVNSSYGPGHSVLVVLDGTAGPWIEAGLTIGLAELIRAGVDVCLLPWSLPLDRQFAERLSQRLSAIRSGSVELLPVATDLPQVAEHMSEALAVVSLRYRALQAAAAAGAPAVAIPVESRIEALAGRLGQICLFPAELGGSLLAAVRRAAETAAPSPALVKEEVARAEAGLALLRLVLEKGDLDTADLEGLPLAPQAWL
jgi:polysaccharide pyruvyl transferase WcaK-like protein